MKYRIVDKNYNKFDYEFIIQRKMFGIWWTLHPTKSCYAGDEPITFKSLESAEKYLYETYFSPKIKGLSRVIASYDTANYKNVE